MSFNQYAWYDTKHLAYYEQQHENWLNGFDELLQVAKSADMKPIDYGVVEQHVFGLGQMGMEHLNRTTSHVEPISYVGITGLEVIGAEVLVVIGGLMVRFDHQGQGFGYNAVQKIMEVARSEEIHDLLGHDGLMAVANNRSRGLFSKLGFVATEKIGEKYMMTAPLVQ